MLTRPQPFRSDPSRSKRRGGSTLWVATIGLGLVITCWQTHRAEVPRRDTAPAAAKSLTRPRALQPVAVTAAALPGPADSVATDGGESSASPPPQADPALLEDWARHHPDEALAWVLRAPSGPERMAIAENLCLQLARINPAAAADLVGEVGADGYVLDNVVQQWAEQDIDAARTYVLGLTPSPDRDRLAERIALADSKHNPAAAATWVCEQISPGAAQNDAAMAVIHQWLAEDRRAALAWIETFPRGSLRDRALDEARRVAGP